MKCISFCSIMAARECWLTRSLDRALPASAGPRMPPNACPVYQQVGGHAYGAVYPGPIGAVITPQLIDFRKAQQLPYASSLCGACREVCPVKIDIPELLLHLRANHSWPPEVTAANSKPRTNFASVSRFVSTDIFGPGKGNIDSGMKAARMLQKLVTKHGKIGKTGKFISAVVPPLRAWTAFLRCSARRSDIISGAVERRP